MIFASGLLSLLISFRLLGFSGSVSFVWFSALDFINFRVKLLNLLYFLII